MTCRRGLFRCSGADAPSSRTFVSNKVSGFVVVAALTLGCATFLFAAPCLCVEPKPKPDPAFVTAPSLPEPADAPPAPAEPQNHDQAPQHVPSSMSGTAEIESLTRPRMVASLSHELQFGVAILIGDGYRGIFPYEANIPCGDGKAGDAARVCTNRAPVFIGIQPSLGLSPSWDVLVDIRFGIRPDFNTKHQIMLMPGFRYWLDPQRQVKFFTTIQLAYDQSDQNSTQVGNRDLGFRNSNGLMVEVMRNFGAYVQFGETVGFVRWLSFTVDAGVGVQARFP